MLRFIIFMCLHSIAYAGVLTLGSTSTTVNSGLMDYLLPYYKDATGHEVKVITGGTGFILQQLERGDVEIAITHQKELEENLLAKFPEGKRQVFMYNHFILVGPQTDPAKVADANSFDEALENIYKHKSLFISRGDNSGSHLFELNIWGELAVDEDSRFRPWYIESGQDMGPTLNMASTMNAYMIADEGTWLAYANKSHLTLLYAAEGEGANDYSLIQLQSSEDLSPQAYAFSDWLLQEETGRLINQFNINGKQGFTAL